MFIKKRGDELKSRSNLLKNLHLILFPFIYTAFEYIHSLGQLAFPWLTIGNTQTYYIEKIQFIEYTGVYGLSFLLLVINVLIYLAIKNIFKKGRILSVATLRYLIVIILIYTIPSIYGFFVLMNSDSEGLRKLKVGLIQPNTNPWIKWEEDRFQQLKLYLDMTKDLLSEEPDIELMVYPETAFSYYILLPAYRHYFEILKGFIDNSGVAILTGLPDAKFYDDPSEAPPSSHVIPETGQRYDAYNAMALILPGSDRIQKYGKIRLVPFAERLPYADTFPFLIEPLKWGVGISSWAIGKDTTVFEMMSKDGDIVKFSGVICYESIYPSFTREFIKRGAEFLIVITNDSWFGNTSGPYQHFQYAILRAVENRRSIVRCANGGISGFIDPYGRVIRKSKFYVRTYMSEQIVLAEEQTFYTRYGDIIAYISEYLTFLAIIYGLILKLKIHYFFAILNL
jgi:apolipoprotein N-acyltransferase